MEQQENKGALSETLPFGFSKVIPLVRIFDVPKAKEFYIEYLGFSIDWEHRFGENFPLYMQVSLNGITLHLTEHYGDCTPGGKVFIETRNLKKYWEYLKTRKQVLMRPGLEDSPWNSIVMEVIDPFNNKLLFNESKEKQG
jgi:hypothetical protein